MGQQAWNRTSHLTLVSGSLKNLNYHCEGNLCWPSLVVDAWYKGDKMPHFHYSVESEVFSWFLQESYFLAFIFFLNKSCQILDPKNISVWLWGWPRSHFLYCHYGDVLEWGCNYYMYIYCTQWNKKRLVLMASGSNKRGGTTLWINARTQRKQSRVER